MQPVTSEQVPLFFGPYRVIGELGRGGSGIVYQAADEQGTDVAVKTVIGATDLERTYLRSEIHALRRIDHPGVVRIFDDGIQDGRPWFAMERLQGETLFEFIERDGARREPRAWTFDTLRPLLQLVERICEPLGVLHASGIVHRDLKPENIILRGGSDPVIVDLGLAWQKLPGDLRATLEPPATEGTAWYMAPEQFSGELVDARTDLYALGCILFELLVGFTPTVNLHGRMLSVPSRFVKGIPASLDALLESLLQPRARHRIGHAEDVRVWLSRLFDHTPQRPITVPATRWLYRPVLSGRSEILAEGATVLKALRRGRGGFVVLEGESGIGKTHIAQELARRAAQDAFIVSAASSPGGEAAREPLGVLSPLFERAAELATEQPEDGLVGSVVKRHLPILASLHRAFAKLGDDIPIDSAPTADQVTLAVREIVFALATDRPLLVLLDDLQWADDFTLQMLASMIDALPEHRVLLLATCRTDEPNARLSELLSLQGVRRVRIGPLPLPDLRELAADMLGVREPPDSIVHYVWRLSEGNPFLAAEYLRHVTSELRLERELDLPAVLMRSPIQRDLDELSTPHTVMDLVNRRLVTLDPTALHMAELLAVCGGHIDAAVLDTLWNDAPSRDALFELGRLQLIETTTDGGRRLLHDRVRVVVYERLGASRRAELHGEAARLLLELKGRARDGLHAAIAHHFALAGRWEEAVPHLEKAAELALSRAAYDAAARHYQDLLEATSRSSADAAPSLSRVARWNHGAARAALGRGDMSASEYHARKTLAAARRVLPDDRWGWVFFGLREAVTRVVPHRRGRDSDSTVDLDAALAASILPYRYFYEQDLVPTIGSALLSANLAARAGNRGGAIGPRSLLGYVAGVFRLHETASRTFAGAQRDAIAERDFREAALSLSTESMYLGGFARWSPAESACHRGLDAAGPLNDPWLSGNLETALTHVEFFSGRISDARRRGARVEELGRHQHTRQQEVWGIYLQARSDIVLERWSSALELLTAATERLTLQREPVSEIACNGMLARTLWQIGDRKRARDLALWVTEEVERTLPPAYPCLVGYTASMHVLCALFEESPTEEHRRLARRMLLSLFRFAAVFPLALPAAFLYAGALLRASGARAAAHATFGWGLYFNRRFEMPEQEHQLLRGVAATTRDPSRAIELVERAERVVATLRAPATADTTQRS